MTLVGLASLIVGGAGIANAVQAFVTRKMVSIATLKCLGASSRDVKPELNVTSNPFCWV